MKYPDGDSIAKVVEAGGLKNMTPEERSDVVLREMHPGDFCDDFPESLRSDYLARGFLESVEVGSAKNKKEPKPVVPHVRGTVEEAPAPAAENKPKQTGAKRKRGG